MTSEATSLEIALGEEGGTEFAAIIWSEAMGIMPFQGKALMEESASGIALKDPESDAQVVLYLDETTIKQIHRRSVVILHRVGDSYNQIPVDKCSRNGG